MILYSIIATCVLVLYLMIEWHWLIPGRGNVAILMYHQVGTSHNHGMTITVDRLREHFSLIKKKGYKVISFSELSTLGLSSAHEKSTDTYVVLTFDDGYKDNHDLLLPLLEEFHFPATIFLTAGCIGKTNTWDDGNEPMMTIHELQTIVASPLIEFGLHAFTHQSYADLSIEEIRTDIQQCTNTLQENHIPYIPAIAYPYGAYPKRDIQKKEQLFALFQTMGIRHALRIGNQLDSTQLKNPYEIKRVNARSTDSLFTFAIKLKKGSRKLFG